MNEATRKFNPTRLTTKFDMGEMCRQLCDSYAMTLCTSWIIEVDGVAIFFFNDSFGEDSIQEYGVIIADEIGKDTIRGRQVESLTVGWMDADTLITALGRCLRYAKGLDKDLPMESPTTVNINHGGGPYPGSCRLCA